MVWPEAERLEKLPELVSQFSSADPVARFWGAQGCLILGKSAASTADQLSLLLNDPQSVIRVAAAHSLFVLGSPEGKVALIEELDRSNDEYSQLNLVNTLTRIDALKDIPDSWVKRIKKDKKAGEYLTRLAERLASERR